MKPMLQMYVAEEPEAHYIRRTSRTMHNPL